MHDDVRKAAAAQQQRNFQITGQGVGGLLSPSVAKSTNECSTDPSPRDVYREPLGQRIARSAVQTEQEVHFLMGRQVDMQRLSELAAKSPETVELIDLLSKLGLR